MSEERPFLEYREDDHWIRIFSQYLDDTDMKWHRDEEDRIIEAIETTDWLFQFEDREPISLNQKIFIPKGVLHRGIKGTGDLKIKIKIYKYI